MLCLTIKVNLSCAARERLSYEPQAVVRIVRIVLENNAGTGECAPQALYDEPSVEKLSAHDVKSGDHSCFPGFRISLQKFEMVITHISHISPLSRM